MEGVLRSEIEHWQFLQNWNEPFPWLSERHYNLEISSDSSNYKWGAVYTENGSTVEFSDYWSNEQIHLHIMLKEALALKNALSCLQGNIRGKRILAHVDNQNVVHAWEKQYSKNEDLNLIMKDIFQIVFAAKCSLAVTYISTGENPSDEASRKLSKSDATISKRVWSFIQSMFGPHTVDAFALDSNAMTDFDGKQLSHFTPYSTPKSGGVDAFAQVYSKDENYYAFPPFCLLPAVIKFILQEQITCTLLFPDMYPHPPWITLVLRYAVFTVPVGYVGDTGVLLYPSKKGFMKDKLGLPFNMLVARFSPLQSAIRRQVLTNRTFSRPPYHTPVLVLSDSMLRFMTGKFPAVEVVSVGGAKLGDISNYLLSEVQKVHPFVVLVHSGTNNINKFHLSEQRMWQVVSNDLRSLSLNLQSLRRNFHFLVIMSGCVYTKSMFINSRVDTLNSMLQETCTQFKFLFVNNSNIMSNHLKDFVHLSLDGEKLIHENLRDFL